VVRGELYRRRPPDEPPSPKPPSRDVAELKATMLLAQARILRPPVDVAYCAEVAGIHAITYSELSERHSAFLMKRGPIVGLIVNRKQPQVRQRFSIAHEIGHWVLERIPETKELAPVAARGRQYDEVERVCNFFAACLLMPRNWTRERFEWGLTNGELAKAFEVSTDAVRLRLRELGYYSRRALP
jgi:hypothetical protein